MKIQITIVAILGVFIVSCSTESPVTATGVTPTSQQSTTNSAPEAIPMVQTRDNPIRYLALGDSDTIGRSVCESCQFQVQLQQSLENTNTKNSFSLK